MSQLTLFNALTGDSTLVDAGDGGGASRMKDWKDEVSRWLKESVEPTRLKGLGLGRLANYPTFLDGEGLSSNPIGNPPDIGTFNGVEVSEVLPMTAVLATGDNSATTFGNVALTDAIRTSANYFNTTTDPDDPVAPAGGQAPAFLQAIVDGGGLNLSATSGVLTFRVNGALHTVTGLTGASVTAEEIETAINTAGIPVDTAVEGGDTLRIFAPGNGITSNIEAVAVAGDVATVLFTGSGQSSQPNLLYKGTNGPLGDMGNIDSKDNNSSKPQRRILPQSVTVSYDSTVMTDDGAGALTDIANASNVGTIDYATGAISLTTGGTTPGASSPITATWKVLRPLTLSDPVRVPPSGKEFAIREK